FQEDTPPESPMADNRTMAELLQAPTDGNEITRFQQRFDELFYEAWERFSDLLRACPHHGFSELHQLDTFYNALNVNDQDLLNSAAGGNFLDKMPRECLKIIESKSKYQNMQNQMATLTDMMSKLVNANTASSYGSGTLPVASVGASMPNLKPSIPYPSRRDNEKRRDQANEQIKKIYEIFKEMSFEISFTDALILMPKFASTLKALIGNKEKLTKMARTMMNEHCSVVILNKFPRKLGDPRKFLIPCEFSGMDECLALADLGASINLMQLSIWEGLSLPELTPTCMTLELTDRSVSKPIGIAKDVSFKVGLFHFPADFVVVDFEPDPRVPLILGRDFLLFEEADAFLGLEDDPDSPKVNPFYYDPNEENELIPTRLVTGWRVCIDYRKLNEATRKDHFPLPFMDQMLERLAGNEYYCFLDGSSGCMLAIFHDMVEKTMEVFMDDFSIFGNSFENCLSRLDKMLQQCEPTNLSLNLEKSHFMVKEGIVLGHKISKNRIEVDRARVDVIAKLPHPTTVKGIRSFLGHAGFYQRFIQDFSKISRPMTHLLEKNTPFEFFEDCIQAFQTLKKKLTEAPILIALNWTCHSSVKDKQENDKIESKLDKNGKRGEAGRSQKQLLSREQEKTKENAKRRAKNACIDKVLLQKKKPEGLNLKFQ
nr:reverse transcriptase domain-containing protein [Tanacetum cinerariifolium]